MSDTDDSTDELVEHFNESLNITDIDSYMKSINKNEDNRFYCIIENCKSSFTRRHGLKKHIEGTHFNKSKENKCDFENCGKKFSAISSLEQHKRSDHNQFKCNFKDCGAILSSKELLKDHKLTHEFWCNICIPAKKFEYKSSLDRHHDDHKKDKSEYYLCPFDICPDNRNINGFPRYDNMIDHVLKKHIKLCKVCWNAFNSDKAYSKHVCKSG